MRYAIPALFLILAFLVLQNWFYNLQMLSPEKEAISFLSDIQSGNVSKAVRHFGTNICHCPKKKGWGAYLAYQTDEEPNLAFLLGNSFGMRYINKKLVPSAAQAWHGIPWEKPEDYLVNVQLDFDKNKYSPYFIPLAMAYGKPITLQELEDFTNHPEDEFWKSFSLRLRSGLEAGAIQFNTTNIDQDVRAEFKFLDLDSQNKSEKQASWYLTPKDAGQIILSDDTKISASEISDKLPRLINTTIQFKIVRKGQLQPWSIAEFTLIESKLAKSNGQIINLLK